MMKEIHEQPAAVRDTISPRIKDGQVDLSELALDEEALRQVRRLYIIGCGSPTMSEWLRGMCLKAWPGCRGSGCCKRIPLPRPGAGARFPSPSSSARAAKPPTRWLRCACAESAACAQSASSMVVGSSIAREGRRHALHLGRPEIAVATTKAYSTQLAACYLLAIAFGHVRGTLTKTAAPRL